MTYDGSLRFSTKVDTSGFEDGSSSLKDAMEKLTRTIERLTDNIVKSFDGTGQAVSNAGKEAEQTADKVDEIADAAKRAKKEAAELEKQMENIDVSLYNSDQKPVQPELPEPERKVDIDPTSLGYDQEAIDYIEQYGKAEQEAAKYTNEFKAEIETLSRKLKELEGQGMYFGDDEYDETYMKLARVKQALADYKHEMLSPTPDVEVPVKLDMNSFEGQKQQLKAQLAELEKNGLTLGTPEYDSVYVALQRVTQAEQEYKRSLMEADQGQQQAKKSADSMKKSMDGVSKSAKGSKKGMTMLGMLGRSILFSFVFRAISGVTNAVKEGFQNLAQYSGGVNGTLSGLMSSLLYLKNSFSTAFAPILDYIVPALNAMINAIASALAWVGQLAAALGGKSSFVKAKKTQEDYAASLKKTGSAAKQAGKDAKKALAPFDKLNVLTDKDSAGGGGATGTDPSEMFETVEIDSKVTSLVDRMKDAFSNFLSWAQENFGPSFQKVWEDMLPNIEEFQNILAGIWGDLGTLAGPLEEWFNTDFVALLQQFL